jgi:hypothetical protein
MFIRYKIINLNKELDIIKNQMDLNDLYEYLESDGFNTEVLRLFVYDLDEMNEYFNLNKRLSIKEKLEVQEQIDGINFKYKSEYKYYFDEMKYIMNKSERFKEKWIMHWI